MSTSATNRRRSTPPPTVELDAREEDTDAGRPLPAAMIDAEDAPARQERRAQMRARLTTALSNLSMAALVLGSLIAGRLTHRWATTTPRFGARDLLVTGAQRTSRDAVLFAAGLREGRNVLSLNLRAVERGVEALPWVARAHASRRLPGSVRIDVEEREAAAFVSASGMYLCASDGTLFKRIGAGDPTDLPVVTGIDRELFASDPDRAREHVRDALALLSDLAGSSLGGRVRVDQVHREATGGLSISLSQGGAYVWLGRGPYRAKLARLSAILAELSRNRLEAAEIHLESDRHPERAAVRLRVRAPVAASLP